MDKAKKFALLAIRILLGLWLLMGSLLLALHPKVIAKFQQTGFSEWARLSLAWSEVVAALLYLYPKTFLIGAWLLVAVLVSAIAMHVYAGAGALILCVFLGLLILTMVFRERPSSDKFQTPSQKSESMLKE